MFCLITILVRCFKNIFKLFQRNNLKVLAITDNLVILNKPYDTKINSNDENEITVQTLLKQIFPSLANEKLCHEFYFPQRLDYATSGVMCVPLNKQECQIISKAFSDRQVEKYYMAMVRGLLSKEIVDIKTSIGEDAQENTMHKMCTSHSKYCNNPRTARTLLLVLEEGIYDNYPGTKLLIKLFTGRRHQIRVHCSHLGHTIIGDYTYSNRKDNEPPRMFLHSIRLVLPTSTEIMDIQTEDPFKDIGGWTRLRIINTLKNNEAYDILNRYCSHY